MSYGKDHRILSEQLEDMVLIESPFNETTRDGLNVSSVLLALTRNKFVIILRRRLSLNPSLYYNRIEAQYSLDDVEISVFKNTRRQVLKACFSDKTVKYFELGLCKKRKIFWDLWCDHVKELKSGRKKWPYQTLKEVYSCHRKTVSPDLRNIPSKFILPDEVIVKSNKQKPRQRWTDKYVYLGANREQEDSVRPMPVTGFRDAIDIRVLLKSEFFENWDQSEQGVENARGGGARVDNPSSTYTGQPTTKVTYTSIITAWK